MKWFNEVNTHAPEFSKAPVLHQRLLLPAGVGGGGSETAP